MTFIYESQKSVVISSDKVKGLRYLYLKLKYIEYLKMLIDFTLRVSINGQTNGLNGLC